MTTIYCGDCLSVMPSLPENSVDSVICDPPYGLDFMGKSWDHGVPGVEFWQAALRVAKPGCILLAFGGTRTVHRLACAIEDAGWEMRDSIGVPHRSGDWGDCPWMLAWIYGSGFPKSLDISKAIDKAAGAEREVVGVNQNAKSGAGYQAEYVGGKVERDGDVMLTAPSTPAAHLWQGWGTALKPAWEPIIVAMKPLEGTYAENAQKWGVAGLNIDGGRIAGEVPSVPEPSGKTGTIYGFANGVGRNGEMSVPSPLGRWPANLILDEEAARLLGEPSRFFYTAKASSSERNAGLEGDTEDSMKWNGSEGHKGIGDFYPDGTPRPKTAYVNSHPTVKPVSLMRYLCKLTRTPTGGVVLDPFMGSGTTGIACILEHRDFIGIEIDENYAEIARKRIADMTGPLFVLRR